MKKYHIFIVFLCIIFQSCYAEDYIIASEHYIIQRHSLLIIKKDFIFDDQGIIKEIILYEDASDDIFDESSNKDYIIKNHIVINTSKENITINNNGEITQFSYYIDETSFFIKNDSTIIEGLISDSIIDFKTGSRIEYTDDRIIINDNKRSYEINFNMNNVVNISQYWENESATGPIVSYIQDDNSNYIYIKDTLITVKGNTYLSDDSYEILSIKGNKKKVSKKSLIINNFILKNIADLDIFLDSAILLSNKKNQTNNYNILCNASNIGIEFEKGFASSTLSESNTIYEIDNLLEYDNLPWVEATHGPGINEEIHLYWNDRITGIVIGNGFYDAKRNSLYNKNNRIKEIQITSSSLENYSETFTLQDHPFPQVITFKKDVKDVIITIKDVYHGSKYDDTCINYIGGIQPDICYEINKKSSFPK